MRYIGNLPEFNIVHTNADRYDYVFASDPAVDVNPSTPYCSWLNLTTGGVFICLDNTLGANVWTGIGGMTIDEELHITVGASGDFPTVSEAYASLEGYSIKATVYIDVAAETIVETGALYPYHRDWGFIIIQGVSAASSIIQFPNTGHGISISRPVSGVMLSKLTLTTDEGNISNNKSLLYLSNGAVGMLRGDMIFDDHHYAVTVVRGARLITWDGSHVINNNCSVGVQVAGGSRAMIHNMTNNASDYPYVLKECSIMQKYQSTGTVTVQTGGHLID